MAEFGSFTLILALVLSFYAFAAGTMALVRGNMADRLAETARRAGIATVACFASAGLRRRAWRTRRGIAVERR